MTVPSELRALLEKSSCVPARMPTEHDEIGKAFCGMWAWSVCGCEVTIEDDELRNENARLIVAAVNNLPALLKCAEACEKIKRTSGVGSNLTNRNELFAKLKRVQNYARAALDGLNTKGSG